MELIIFIGYYMYSFSLVTWIKFMTSSNVNEYKFQVMFLAIRIHNVLSLEVIEFFGLRSVSIILVSMLRYHSLAHCWLPWIQNCVTLETTVVINNELSYCCH